MRSDLVRHTLGTWLALTVTLAQVAWAQRLAYAVEQRSRLVGVKPLHAETGWASNEREARIWLGFGMIEPETFTSIHTDGRSVEGRKVFWWSHATKTEEAAADRDPDLISNKELYANLQKTAGCEHRRRRGDYETCRAQLAPGQSWEGILQALDSLGLGDLAPSNSIGLDGWFLVVELRDGATYRTYSYFMPDTAAAQPQERRAAAIVELVGRIGYRE